MSENGWRAILDAEGLEDRVSRTAVVGLLTPREGAAAASADAIAQVPGPDGTRARLIVVSGRLTVRLAAKPDAIDVGATRSWIAAWPDGATEPPDTGTEA